MSGIVKLILDFLITNVISFATIFILFFTAILLGFINPHGERDELIKKIKSFLKNFYILILHPFRAMKRN